MKAILLFMTILFFFQGCTKQEIEPGNREAENGKLLNEFPVTIKSAYFEGWISGVQGGGSGMDFFIELGEPLPKGVFLKNVLFRDTKAAVFPLTELLFVARLSGEINSGEGIPMDYDTFRVVANAIPSTSPIKDDQALLEYVNNGEVFWHLIPNVKEQEPDFYPE
ncbi:hypothetical protein FSS13T_11450 [Flavobacterium saliperosum S13]|uniref:Lipoprotein n=2 Tax=Flavobacterium saliperosum TaxID=329186 RepID=A0A1G4W3N6_9FLAO|nr:hypothetical protein [Flavobacterium saliperosum]ESU26157.1 hypothetical protein FSS13T_11450 [Flavobacterium saliperosum S13]SCX16228.1 hypothetical protein SAMN02927925_02357 [Flavobacterium saliperosum]